jgi:peroxiredoxin
VNEVIILAVNDGAVMMNWAKSQKVGLSMLTFLGDPKSEFTRALDLEMTHPGPASVLGPGRCKRFAMHVVDGVIKAVNVSEGPDDPAGDKDPSASMADAIMATMD